MEPIAITNHAAWVSPTHPPFELATSWFEPVESGVSSLEQTRSCAQAGSLELLVDVADRPRTQARPFGKMCEPARSVERMMDSVAYSDEQVRCEPASREGVFACDDRGRA